MNDTQLPVQTQDPAALSQPVAQNSGDAQPISTLQPVQVPQVDEGRPGVMSQVLSQVAAQPPDTLNPPVATPGLKEQERSGIQVVEPSADLPSGVQAVEVERSPELPPEVAKFVEEVQEHEAQMPKEIVIADHSGQTGSPTLVPKPVIVLPVTQQQVQQGKHAKVNSSLRWLSEWSERIMKMFGGSVVYEDDPALKN